MSDAPFDPIGFRTRNALKSLEKFVRGQPLEEADRLSLRQAPTGQDVPRHLAESIGYNGPDLRKAALWTLQIDEQRREILSEIAACTEGKWRPAIADSWVARVRMIRGGIPISIRTLLHLGTFADWQDVGDKLETILRPAAKVGAR